MKNKIKIGDCLYNQNKTKAYQVIANNNSIYIIAQIMNISKKGIRLSKTTYNCVTRDHQNYITRINNEIIILYP